MRALRAVAVFQPQLIGNLHLWHRVWCADAVVLLSNVQFSPVSVGGKTGQGHVRVGESTWAGVKVRERMLPINQTRVTPGAWERLADRLCLLYGGAPFWDEADPLVEALWCGGTVGEAAVRSFQVGCEGLGLSPAVYSDDGLEGAKADLVEAAVRRADGDVYLSGGYGREYLPAMWDGILIRFQDWLCPRYDRGANPWVPDLSLLDAVAWTGWAGARMVVQSNRGAWRNS